MRLKQSTKNAHDFSHAFNEVIERKGLTKKQVARRIGISVPHVERWQNGDGQPHPYFRELILEQLETL